MKHTTFTGITLVTLSTILAGLGCRSHLIDGTDRQVYHAIQDRQLAALGETSDANIGSERGELDLSDRMYSFNPRPVDPEIPENFRISKERARGAPVTDAETPEPQAVREPGAPPEPDESGTKLDPVDALHGSSAEDETEVMASQSIFSEEQQPDVRVFGLRDALRYAVREARDLQDAKEALYLAALDLTLERHLWTPQFVASIQADFADFGQVRDFDRAMTATSDFAVSQRLPYGGEVTARIVNTLMRDLGVHTTSGESGNVILSADLPLLRGAGKVAYESRYVAERDLIYAVRIFERFRRTFLVEVASRYFNLQGLKSAIANTYRSYEGRRGLWLRSDFINRMGQSRSVFEAPRAKSSFRRAESALVSAKERYETALDQFKIFIGMPVTELLDVVEQDSDKAASSLDSLLPSVDMREASDVALGSRLDYVNSADRLDDARRGVLIAENAILPDLDARLSGTVASDPERFNATSFNLERTTWRGAFELRMDDRKRERNAYRESLVGVRRAERDLELMADRVLADVRRAMRRVRQQESLRAIQEMQVSENILRAEAALAQFDLGMSTNQDVVDAEDELLTARNDLASAISAYRISILEFRRDTGTLRVGDEGQWLGSETISPQDLPPNGP